MILFRITSYHPVRKLAKMLFSTTTQDYYKVAVLGAAGGIGQPLGLLLKHNPLITHLALYDVSKITPGVGVDISHINTAAEAKGYHGADQLVCALEGADVVVIPAGLPRKPGMTRQDLFKLNAGIIYELAIQIAKTCPCALIAIITNPVNSAVPIVSEVMIKSGVYNPCRIFGVTTLDLVRASTFVAQFCGLDPSNLYVPVIGGHAGTTIIPLLSQCQPSVPLANCAIISLTKRIQDAGTEVVKAKSGGGSATLSMAFSAARFAGSLLRGLCGENVMECAYVKSDVTEAKYFATPVLLGSRGLQTNLGFSGVSKYENDLIQGAIPQLQKNIKAGVDFVASKWGK